MLKRIALPLAVLSLCAARPAAAQSTSGGTITGIVRDTASRPVAGADVVAHPGSHRTTTDSAGRFTFSGLDADNYVVRARKLGYAPEEWDVKLAKSGHVDIQLRFTQRMPMLDTVNVRADGECPEFTLEGFACRRRNGGGLFMDYNEIDDQEPLYVADLFREIKGFRESMRSTPTGPTRVVVPATSYGCVNSLVNGREVTGANRIPEYPIDLIALEVYVKPDSVPKQYQQYTWPRGNVARTGRCSVVIYWNQLAKWK
jgi:hypothetical protein